MIRSRIIGIYLSSTLILRFHSAIGDWLLSILGNSQSIGTYLWRKRWQMIGRRKWCWTAEAGMQQARRVSGITGWHADACAIERRIDGAHFRDVLEQWWGKDGRRCWRSTGRQQLLVLMQMRMLMLVMMQLLTHIWRCWHTGQPGAIQETIVQFAANQIGLVGCFKWSKTGKIHGKVS